MFTLVFDENNDQPLYEQLYHHIRESIEENKIKEGERLPSKRKLASHLQISQSTVENAYAQLIAEGYIQSVEKKGYYARAVERILRNEKLVVFDPGEAEVETDTVKFDLKTNAVDTDDFPFSIWTRLMRECLQKERSSLLRPIHPQGDARLRQEIVAYLREFRNMEIHEDQVVLGAGTEYLLGLITELLPFHTFAFENPGYHKTSKILQSRRVTMQAVSMDSEGMSIEELKGIKTKDMAAFVTPSHHFPLGIVMSINRRRQLLQWAAQEEERYLIEDDYDSEYRFALKPIPSLHSLDKNDKVIYMNTFARTLAPSLRIGYMVLPRKLLRSYEDHLMFYSCTVSEFEQCTLRGFLQGGYYERHLNRMRNIYRSRRDILLEGLLPLSGAITISGQESGLHLLIHAKNGMTEEQLIESAIQNGVRVYGLSRYYLEEHFETNTVLAGYGGFRMEELREAAHLLVNAWR